MERARFLVIGAGVAGAATAYGLARAGEGDVILLERELFPGSHASGRNAALIRRNLKTETDCKLSLQAADWMREPPDDFARDLQWQETGSLLLFSERHRARAEREFSLQRECGLRFDVISPRAARERQPLLDERAIAGAQWTPGDGRIDIIALLEGYLAFAQQRGARLRCGARVESLRFENGRCTGANTNIGEFHATIVVNAAGGWANSLLGKNAPPLAMTPCRRTMLVTEPIGANANDPFTWDDGRGFYFREDNGGLLWSPCDEVPREDCDERVDPEWVARARACARELTPSVADAKIAFSWGCLRTLTFDREMMVGHDPLVPGLFWVAGLGGHGVTLSPRIADLAADLLLSSPQESAGPSRVVDPRRVAPRRPVQ
jgi:glycine/D-amino acid oxidase-like deaminating enzyme